MNAKLFILTTLTAVCTAGAAQADVACLIEGKVMTDTIRDCTQTSLPIPAAQYAEQCKSNASGPLKATVLKACPAKAQASCVDPFGQKVTIFYYARSPQSLADTKTSCAAQRGRWVDRPN